MDFKGYTFAEDSKGTVRGRETLFRVTFRNQIQLIGNADTKANIIVSINSLIITLTIAGLSSGIVTASSEGIDKEDLVIPVLIIIMTCLISAVYAILAAKPKLIKAHKNPKGMAMGKFSLLFFGNYYQKSMDEYLEEMDKLLSSKKAIYENMIIDIYNQGKVLHRKYYLLSLSYTVFMVGFVLSVCSFLLMWLVV